MLVRDGIGEYLNLLKFLLLVALEPGIDTAALIVIFLVRVPLDRTFRP